MPDHSHTLKALNEELKILQREQIMLDGEVEYHSGMLELKKKMLQECEDKVHDISQSIFHLENA